VELNRVGAVLVAALVVASIAAPSVSAESTPPTISEPTVTEVTDAGGNIDDRLVGDGDEVQVTATVTDEGSGVDSVTVDASDFGGASAVTLSPSPDGSDTYAGTFFVDSGSASADGDYALTVTATDVDGNSATDTTGSLELDTTAPAPTVAVQDFYQRDSTVGQSSTVAVSAETSDEGLTVTADLSPIGGPASVATTFQSGESQPAGYYGSATIDPLGNGVTDGSHAVTVTATDATGNSETFSTSLNVDTSDGTAPTVTSVSVSESSDSDGVTTDDVVGAGDDLAVSADVSDGGAGVRTVTVDGSDFGASGSVRLVDGDADGVYDGTFTVQENGASADGTYPLTVTVTDDNDNAATKDTAGVELDTTAPSGLTATARDGADSDTVVADDATVEVGLDATDTDYTVTADGTPFGATSSETLSYDADRSGFVGSFTVDATDVADGEKPVAVTATDETGNANTFSTTLTLNADPPSLSNENVADGDEDGTVTAGDTVTVSVDVDSPGSAVSTVTADASAFGAGGSVDLSLSTGSSYTGTFTVQDSATDGDQSVTIAATDGDGKSATVTTGTLTVATGDATPPSIAINSVTNGNADGDLDDGEQVTVSADVTDSGAGVDTVEANARKFGGGVIDLTLSSGSTYTGTFTVDAAQAADAGSDYPVTVRAADAAGNRNSQDTSPLSSGYTSSGDTGAPSVTSVTATDKNADGTVTDGETVALSADVSDGGTGVASVTADASQFGASGSVTLSDGDGDGTYTGSFTADAASATSGDHAITVTATDAASTSNSASDTTGTLTMSTADATAPTISTFQVTSNDPLKLDFSFESDETLDDLQVTITDGGGTTVKTYTENDLAGSTFNGNYIYGDTWTAPSTGTYTVTLDWAKDAAGNDGADASHTASKALNVQSVSMTQVDGETSPTMANVDPVAFFAGGALQIQLQDKTASGTDTYDKYELYDQGFRAETKVRIDVVIDNYKPRVLYGTGDAANWTVTERDDGTTKVSVTLNPATQQLISSRLTGSPGAWPTDPANDVADESYDATLSLFVYDMNTVSSLSERNAFNGTVVLTDAQEFQSPSVKTVDGKKALDIWVAGPHFLPDGTTQNTGFYETFLPSSLLTSWGVSSPGQLTLNAMGTTTAASTTYHTAAGIRFDVPIHYSSGNVQVQQGDTAAPTVSGATVTDATDGDGTVDDGDSVTVSARASDTGGAGLSTVTVDASDLGAGTVTLTDGNGDGTYDGTFSVAGGSASPDGDYALTVTATDGAGATATATTASIALSTDGGGGGGSVSTVDEDDTDEEDADATEDAETDAATGDDTDTVVSVTIDGTTATYDNGTLVDGNGTVVDDSAGNLSTGANVTVSVNGNGSAVGSNASATIPGVRVKGNASAAVTTDANRTSVRVENATGNDSVAVDLPRGTVDRDLASTGAALETMETDFARDTNFDASVSASASPPPDESDPERTVPAVDESGDLGYLTVDTGDDFEESDVSEVRFTFSVAAERLNERELAADDVVLYRHHGGDWNEIETTLIGTTDGGYRFQARSPGLSVFAISRRNATATPAPTATSTTATTATSTTTATSAPTATPTTTPDPTVAAAPSSASTPTDAPAPTTGTRAPGFGVVVALGGLLSLAAALRRRVD
jgi:hypothetical protein